MVGQTLSKGRYAYYRCRRSYAGSFEGTCDSRYVPVEALERVVLEQVAQVLSDPGRILEEAKRLGGQGFDTARLEAIAEELKRVEMQLSRLADLYIRGSMPESILEEKNKELGDQRMRLEAERQAIQVPTQRTLDLDQLSATLPEAATRLRQWVLEASEDDMELILRAL